MVMAILRRLSQQQLRMLVHLRQCRLTMRRTTTIIILRSSNNNNKRIAMTRLPLHRARERSGIFEMLTLSTAVRLQVLPPFFCVDVGFLSFLFFLSFFLFFFLTL